MQGKLNPHCYYGSFFKVPEEQRAWQLREKISFCFTPKMKNFYRFLKGWSPGHWKINTYSERISSEVVRTLQKETGI